MVRGLPSRLGARYGRQVYLLVIVIVVMVIRVRVYDAGAETGGDDQAEQKEFYIFECAAWL
jgi:hypothetical protein